MWEGQPFFFVVDSFTRFSADIRLEMAPKKGGGANKPRGNATEEVEETLQAVVSCYLEKCCESAICPAGMLTSILCRFWQILLKLDSNLLLLINLGYVLRYGME